MSERISLEQSALEFSIANESEPYIYQLPVEEARALLEKVQDSPVEKFDVDSRDETWDLGEQGSINVRIIKPKDTTEKLPVILYIHGAGWVLGSAHTHDKLVRELSVRTNSIVFVPEYDRSPEAKYPVAIEQSYATLLKLVEEVEDNYDIGRITVAGDSVGGNMATVITMLAKDRQGPKINQQLLYYPVTNHSFDTDSYNQFATDYFLAKDGMKWFWDNYLPEGQDTTIKTISPLQATKEELTGLPAAMILNGEADVLRDEGEEYARHLRDAGVDVSQVRFQGMIHDFVMVNSMDQSNAARAAMDLSTAWLNKRNK
ncbi:alpha/beta hydrolase [Enterococcus pallens]|uniref:Alpha/beta hydrolase fold protein n=1 Tax=Enterococcus pallens ATCC BAA-351 TaxID=1158607 RepID=R2RZ37_9ENTE|nr:alpha/beta hydrolase [Enterococcus pallens]EOH88525.1 alpha/beta hydrolase fold protein [Enterococcus pallens ATCC BAA-351]EOU17706.1 alpha/beta hydrolase fold protein [Enterococcus pallens ATCC BAA-351]